MRLARSLGVCTTKKDQVGEGIDWKHSLTSGVAGIHTDLWAIFAAKGSSRRLQKRHEITHKDIQKALFSFRSGLHDAPRKFFPMTYTDTVVLNS